MKSSFCIDLQRFMLIPTKFPLSRFWLVRSYHEQAFFDLFTYFIYKFPFSADYFLTFLYKTKMNISAKGN